MTEESIEISLRDLKKKQKMKTDYSALTPTKVQGNTSEEYLLSLLVQNENPREVATEIGSILECSDFTEPVIRKIMELLLPYLKKNQKFDVKDFGNLLTPEIEGVFNKAFLTEINNILSKEHLYKKEILVKAYEIKKNSLRRKVVELSTKIKIGEEKNEDVSKLNQELKNMIDMVVKIDKNLYNSRSDYGKNKNTFIS